jgi:hypothetical protein
VQTTVVDTDHLSANSPQTASATLTVLNHSSPQFAGGAQTLDLNFGTVSQGSLGNLQYQIQNAAGLRAGLALDSISIISGSGLSLTSTAFSNLAPGGTSSLYNVTLNASTVGSFSGEIQLNVSDETDLPGHGNNKSLYIYLTGNVAPAQVFSSATYGGATTPGAQPGGAQATFSSVPSSGTLETTYATGTNGVSLAALAGAEAATAAANFKLPGNSLQAWDVSLNGGSFTGTADLVFNYDPALIGNGTPASSLAILHWDDGGWVTPPGEIVDAADHVIMVPVSSFSPFLLTETASPVPEPSTFALIGAGAAGAIGYAALRRRRGMTAC